MKTETIQSVAAAGIFIWTGFICAISFLEARLKFKAPGVTLQIGLGIGRLVFNALNRAEWVLAFIIACCILPAATTTSLPVTICLVIAVIVLLIQTCWLLPRLGARAELYISGKQVEGAGLHHFFVAGEIIKVLSLFVAGICFLNKI